MIQRYSWTCLWKSVSWQCCKCQRHEIWSAKGSRFLKIGQAWRGNCGPLENGFQAELHRY